jgi:hypothetical protein
VLVNLEVRSGLLPVAVSKPNIPTLPILTCLDANTSMLAYLAKHKPAHADLAGNVIAN